MRLMTICVGLVVLGCAGASGEDTERTGSSEQAVGANVGNTFEQSLQWSAGFGKVTEVCTLSLLEPPQPLVIYAHQLVDALPVPNGSADLQWNGESAMMNDSLGRDKERVELTSNCPGVGCRVEIKLFMKGWEPDSDLGCEISAENQSGYRVADGYASDSTLHVNRAPSTLPLGGYSYRQKLLMNIRQTRVGHQCMFRETELPPPPGMARIDPFDVVVAGTPVLGGPTVLPVADGAVQTVPFPPLGSLTSGVGTTTAGLPFILARHSIGRDGTIAPGDWVRCVGAFYSLVPEPADFDVNLTVPPNGGGMLLRGAEAMP